MLRFAALPAFYAWTLFASAALLVTAAYLLKRTPRPQIVSNILFFQRALAKAKPRALLSKKLPWLPWLVSLLIALLMMLFLSDPIFGSEDPSDLVLIIKADRSMQTENAQGLSRLSEAKTLAIAQLATAHPLSRIVVLRAGAYPSLVNSNARDRGQIERAIRSIEADYEEADAEAALSLAKRTSPRTFAASNAPSNQGGADAAERTLDNLLWIGDRNVAPSDAHGTLPTFLSVGTTASTLAITAFGARRFESQDGRYRLRLEVTSFAKTRGQGEVLVKRGDAEIFREAFSLEPGQHAVLERTFERSANQTAEQTALEAQDQSLTASLSNVEIEGDVDRAKDDDVAYAVLPADRPLQVLAISRGDAFFKAALLTHPSFDVRFVETDAQIYSDEASIRAADILVLDRVSVEGAGDKPVIAFADPSRIGQRLQRQEIVGVMSAHPAVEGLHLEHAIVSEPYMLQAKGDAAESAVLLRAGEGEALVPLALVSGGDANTNAGNNRIDFAFAPSSASFATSETFPLLIHQSIGWAAKRAVQEGECLPPSWFASVAPEANANASLPPSASESAAPRLEVAPRQALVAPGHFTFEGETLALDDFASRVSREMQSQERAQTTAVQNIPWRIWIFAAALFLLAIEWIALLRGRLA